LSTISLPDSSSRLLLKCHSIGAALLQWSQFHTSKQIVRPLRLVLWLREFPDRRLATSDGLLDVVDGRSSRPKSALIGSTASSSTGGTSLQAPKPALRSVASGPIHHSRGAIDEPTPGLSISDNAVALDRRAAIESPKLRHPSSPNPITKHIGTSFPEGV